MDSLARQLRDYFAPREDVAAAYLFGSQARSAAHAQSDVDVALVFTEREDAYSAFMHLCDYSGRLEDFLNTSVDVVDLERCNPMLAFAVLSEGILVSERCSDRRVAVEVRQTSFYHDLSPGRELYLQDLMRRGMP